MKEHIELLSQDGLSIPPKNPEPTIIIQNEKKVSSQKKQGIVGFATFV